MLYPKPNTQYPILSIIIKEPDSAKSLTEYCPIMGKGMNCNIQISTDTHQFGRGENHQRTNTQGGQILANIRQIRQIFPDICTKYIVRLAQWRRKISSKNL